MAGSNFHQTPLPISALSLFQTSIGFPALMEFWWAMRIATQIIQFHKQTGQSPLGGCYDDD
jgi:hypothetical protein